MANNKWDLRFLALAEHISSWSKDPSTKVGAVVVQGVHIVGVGYNGFPKGVGDHTDRYANRDMKLKLVVHAEVNACLDAGRDAKDGTLYVWPTLVFPPVCNECAKVIIQSGIREVIGFEKPIDPKKAELWKEASQLSKLMLDEAGVSYRPVK